MSCLTCALRCCHGAEQLDGSRVVSVIGIPRTPQSSATLSMPNQHNRLLSQLKAAIGCRLQGSAFASGQLQLPPFPTCSLLPRLARFANNIKFAYCVHSMELSECDCRLKDKGMLILLSCGIVFSAIPARRGTNFLAHTCLQILQIHNVNLIIIRRISVKK